MDMKPYFETSLGKLLCGDCLEIMKQLPDKSVDLVLTDPPYGIKIGDNGKIGGNGKITKVRQYIPVNWDNEGLNQIQFEEIKRISTHQIIFGFNYFLDILKPTQCIIVWDKKCRNDWNDNFSDCELAWTSFNKPAKVFHYLWMGALKEGKERERWHPTQKPIALIIWILENYSQENNLILDPFLGSGTTAVACEKLNRRWIGIEINPEYCEIAKKRIQDETKQGKLF